MHQEVTRRIRMERGTLGESEARQDGARRIRKWVRLEAVWRMEGKREDEGGRD